MGPKIELCLYRRTVCGTTFGSPTVLEVFRYEGLVTRAYEAIVELKCKHGLMSKPKT